MWPFSKKQNQSAEQREEPVAAEAGAAEHHEAPIQAEREMASSPSGNTGPAVSSKRGVSAGGPFDGDTEDFRDFDFSDFAKGGLDLGSILVAVPHDGEVQVEMGEAGPQMVHVLTPYGRITPVAFAAPRNGGLWQEKMPEMIEGMESDGLDVSVEQGPWGEEISASFRDGAMRMIGIDGDRWMYRLTLAGPAESADDLARVAREVAARSFIRRGKDPVPAGDALPVRIPQAMVEEVQRQLQLQAQQAQGEQES